MENKFKAFSIGVSNITALKAMKNLLVKTFLGVLFALVALTASAQNKTVRDHTKLQNSLSYEARIKSNTGFTRTSAKRALASEKEKAKARKKTERENKKRDAIYARIEELKAN